MKRNFRNIFLCSACLILSGAVQADTAGPCGIATDVSADGSVELSNTANTTPCDSPVKAAGSAADQTAPTADAQSAQADPPKDPREAYHDKMLQGVEGTTAANPSVSRRYKMMDKATYQATVPGAAPQAPQGQPAQQ
jgi:hypothetical protein